MSESLDLLEEKCSPDGKWKVEGAYWRAATKDDPHKPSIEVVDWGRKGQNEMITLNALVVLGAAEKLQD